MIAVSDEKSGVAIGVVENETGLTRDVLRKWEMRYGFPLPGRDLRGERVYPPAQLDRLRLIKRLLDRGMRPARVVALDEASLRLLADAAPVASQHPVSDRFVLDVFSALVAHDPESLRRILAHELMRLGISEFVQARLVVLHELVGDAWADGRLAVHQEHLYCETVQTLLREAISRLPTDTDGPRVLLATPPDELHSLGILMVQALLSLAGARCLSLGSQVPMSELLAAASGYRADIIGISFSIAYPVRRIAPQLAELRRHLDPAVQVWVGGQGMARVRSVPAGVQVFRTLADAVSALATRPVDAISNSG